MTIVWLKLIASEMIAIIETFGEVTGCSTAILGVTVIAIGNSIGDLVADTAAAREGTISGTRMAIAATFGSPVIMNIVSVGLSFTLRLAVTAGQVCSWLWSPHSLWLMPCDAPPLLLTLSDDRRRCSQPICFASVTLITRLGYLLFYLTIASHLLVFPLCGYRAPRVYALYLFGIYASLLVVSVLLELEALDGSWLCTGFSWLFNECHRPVPDYCG